ncbi:MAG: hypothetical protein SFV17_27010 [Candidatus Obscuribacter sp.]|nr:hypothetical protein [Candidatus Obscuribacter sp.]
MGYYSNEIEQGKPPDNFFDGDKVLQEDELARRLRSNDSTDRQSQVDPSKPEPETKPEQNRASDQPPGSGAKIRSYDDFILQVIEESIAESNRMQKHDQEMHLQSKREKERRFDASAAPREPQHKLEAEKSKLHQGQQEHFPTNSKSWSKYLPW